MIRIVETCPAGSRARLLPANGTSNRTDCRQRVRLKATTPAGTKMNSKTILVHDPDFENQVSLCRILSLNGYVPLEAANEQHAEVLCRNRERRIDLVVADISFLTVMRRRGLCANTPRIALEASGEETDFRVRCLRAPFSTEHFLAQVRSVLAEARSKAEILVVDDDVSSRAASCRHSGTSRVSRRNFRQLRCNCMLRHHATGSCAHRDSDGRSRRLEINSRPAPDWRRGEDYRNDRRSTRRDLS